MATPEPESSGSFWPILAAVGAAVICCAGPVLVALVATTGLGMVAVRSGAFIAVGMAGVVAALVLVGAIWRRRRACAGPAVPGRSQFGQPRGAHDGDAPAGVPGARAR